jgi:MFS family permease
LLFLLASFKIPPSPLLWLSVIISALSALLVSFTASWSLTMLATGSFAGGLGVSGQYAAVFSWLAEHVDVTVN